MTETRTVHDPFLGKDVQVGNSLVDRLRGKYAQGPTMPNGEPEFGWRQFPVPPIQVAAADEIECLRAALTTLVDAKALSGVRKLVAGWNGEGRDGGPFKRHPYRLGATLPKTYCGEVYELDEAMQIARAILSGAST
jgi:hypothetical protein